MRKVKLSQIILKFFDISEMKKFFKNLHFDSNRKILHFFLAIIILKQSGKAQVQSTWTKFISKKQNVSEKHTVSNLGSSLLKLKVEAARAGLFEWERVINASWL